MENKKSFVLYCDLIHTVERLSDEQAGDLFKHILRYVNDLNPQTDNFITELAFEPVKQQLKRDLVQWLSFVEKQRENGRKGGRPPKPKVISETQPFISEPKKDVNDNDNDYSKNNHKSLELTKGIVKGNQPIESLGSVETSGVSIDTQSPQGFLPKGYVDVEDDVTSKGYKKFLESFPLNKRRHSDEAYQIWESLTQGEKQQLFKHLKSHISKLKTEGKEQFLKNSEKYLESGEWKNLVQRTTPKGGISVTIDKPGVINYGFYNWYSKLAQLPPHSSLEEWKKDFNSLPQNEQNEFKEIYIESEKERLNLLNQNTQSN